MAKIFIVYSHYNEKSFNYAIKETFIKKAKDEGSIRKDLNFSIFRDQFFGGLEHIGIRKILPGKPINIGQDAADLVNIIYSGISNK